MLFIEAESSSDLGLKELPDQSTDINQFRRE